MMEVSIDVLLKIRLEKLTSPSGSMLLVNQKLFNKIYKRRLVSSRCSALYCRAILQTLDGTNTGSKIDEENVLPLLCRRQMDRHSSFSYKEDKPYALSPASSLHRLAGNLTNPHTSRQE